MIANQINALGWVVVATICVLLILIGLLGYAAKRETRGTR